MKILVIESIFVALAILTIPVSSVFASDFEPCQRNREAINPDFSPDQSCLFDTYQDKCVPGSQQKCPEGFGNNEDYTCVPLHERCPEGYHSEDDDETGQCYPNSEGCSTDEYLLTDDTVDGRDVCVKYRIDCDLNQDHPLCNGQERSDGLLICDQPDHPGYKFCLRNDNEQ
jgi:hypothetical protein